MSDSGERPNFLYRTAEEIVPQEIGMGVKKNFLKGRLKQALKALEASQIRPLGGPVPMEKRQNISNKFVGWRRR